jgi:hypothetical protein
VAAFRLAHRQNTRAHFWRVGHCYTADNLCLHLARFSPEAAKCHINTIAGRAGHHPDDLHNPLIFSSWFVKRVNVMIRNPPRVCQQYGMDWFAV